MAPASVRMDTGSLNLDARHVRSSSLAASSAIEHLLTQEYPCTKVQMSDATPANTTSTAVSVPTMTTDCVPTYLRAQSHSACPAQTSGKDAVIVALTEIAARSASKPMSTTRATTTTPAVRAGAGWAAASGAAVRTIASSIGTLRCHGPNTI